MRTPGLHDYVAAIEAEPLVTPNPSPRRFDRVYKDNWWCGIYESSATIAELDDSQPIPTFVVPRG